MVLNTGRIRDQWHTMTRSGRAARLNSHMPEPFVDMHPADALSFALRDNTLVRVATRWGRLVVRLRCSGEMTRGSIFVPIHWNDTLASDARVAALISPAVDPLSGEPEFKFTPARVEPFVVNWYGVALTRRPMAHQALTWWCRTVGNSFLRYEVAGRHVPGDWSSYARTLFGADRNDDWIDYVDSASGTFRAALLHEDRLQSCLFVSSRPELPSRAWLAGLFEYPRLGAGDRAMLLAGKPADPAADVGTTVCACFGVGSNAIAVAIAQGCRDAQSIGRQLKAGTNCGSCIPELHRMIAAKPPGLRVA